MCVCVKRVCLYVVCRKRESVCVCVRMQGVRVQG